MQDNNGKSKLETLTELRKELDPSMSAPIREQIEKLDEMMAKMPKEIQEHLMDSAIALLEDYKSQLEHLKAEEEKALASLREYYKPQN